MTTQTPTLGYIKCTPYVYFTSSFIDIVFGQYVRRGMKEKLPPKMWNTFAVTSFHPAISPMVSHAFHEKRESGVWNQCIFKILLFILSISYIEIIPEATKIQSFYHSSVSCGISVEENVFVSGCDYGLPHVDGKPGLGQ